MSNQEEKSIPLTTAVYTGALLTALSIGSGAFLHSYLSEPNSRRRRYLSSNDSGSLRERLGQSFAEYKSFSPAKESYGNDLNGGDSSNLFLKGSKIDQTELVVPDHGLHSLVNDGSVFQNFSRDLHEFVQPASIDIPIHLKGKSGGQPVPFLHSNTSDNNSNNKKDGFHGGTMFLMKHKRLPLGSSVRKMLKDLVLERVSPDAVLLKGQTYLVYCGIIDLPKGLRGVLSPKSSIGRIDLMVRGITDGSGLYDIIESGSARELWLEVTPNSFNVRLHDGLALTQLMIFCPKKIGWTQFGKSSFTNQCVFPSISNGNGPVNSDPSNSSPEVQDPGESSSAPQTPSKLRGNSLDSNVDDPVMLYNNDGSPTKVSRFNNGDVMLSLAVNSLCEDDNFVGYEAIDTAEVIDLNKRDLDPSLFFRPIEKVGSTVTLSKDRFYILATKENISIPPRYSAEVSVGDSSDSCLNLYN